MIDRLLANSEYAKNWAGIWTVWLMTRTGHPDYRDQMHVWLENEFSIKDEIYQYKHWQPEKVRVLMSLNMAKCELKKPYHVPVAWVKNFGEGKVFYTNLGHNTETWTNKHFIESLLGGIKWVLGLEEGDARSPASHRKGLPDHQPRGGRRRAHPRHSRLRRA